MTYGTVLGADGKCWLDRNLGATRVATAYNDSAAYGWIFQWGRGVDGHQIVRPTPSGTTTVLSLTDTPGHANFIKNDNAPRDWRSTRNDNLWQGEDGINNPCPTGFRLPTITEWSAIVSAAGITNYNTAFSSNLKFTTAGMRNGDTAAIVSQGIGGYYWSTSLTGSTLKTIYAPRIVVSAVDLTENWRRAYACSVRCLENSNIFMPAYASQLYTFDTSAYANQSKLELNLLAYATASAGNGITTKIWNNDTSTWETLESLANTSATMPETPSTQQITANVEDYLDVDKKIRILVHSTNPSASGTDAILNTDYLKLTVWVSPSVSTNATTGITFNSATGNGNVTNTNGEDPISRDIQWGTTSGIYTDSCSAGAGSSGVYSCPITNLAPNTTYYYRAKATNSSGSGYGEEQSFTTLAGEITVSNPTPTDITELYTDSYIAFDSGTLDSTNQVTTHIDVTLATGANQITLPDNTVITNTEGGNFDMSAFDITLRDVRSEVPDSLAAIKVGVPGTQLTFTNNPVTLNIYLGSQHNGKTMQIQYQNENEALWNDQGSCVITDSLCTFTTTHATTYSVNGDGSLQGE
ncbi:MAG: FISUMP domain-containing protein, partial [Candidatus Planktophila sp.]|nr:FISUMP domain-containing protein [Candidatus Planktophila sp.]